MARAPRTTDRPSHDLTDEELGIGEDDVAEVDNATAELSALLANPAMQKLIDAAVANRLAGMAAPQGGSAPVTNDALEKLAATLSRMFELQQMQQPGYQKPLPVDEIERRLAGKVEMDALLADYQAKNTPPLWTVGEGGFFECANALEFVENDRIRTYLPPAEDFVPENEEARKVHAAMMRWLGGRTPDIGSQVEAAQRAAKMAPLLMGTMTPPMGASSAATGGVELVERPEIAPRKSRRQTGSIVPEPRAIVGGGDPVGPSFADAVAA